MKGAWVLLLAVALALAMSPAGRASAGGSSTGLTPLNDLGAGTYLGFQGGLYENGTNAVPAGHAAAGLAQAAAVQPLDTNGAASATGKVVLLSVGMSNTTQEFCSGNSALPCSSWTFMGQAAVDPRVNHETLAVVNGAAGGQSAATWDELSDPNYDRVRDTRLAPQGLSEQQVQAAWVKVANPGPNSSLPSPTADAYTLEMQMGNIVRVMKMRYPNLRLVFLSSRIYAGYATTTLNPEPYAYQSGFSVKWLVQAQVDQMRNNGVPVDPRAGDLNYGGGAPWVAWGPYLWADGLVPRSDGLVWLQADLQPDGTHPSPSGQEKVGTMLLDFFTSSPFVRSWFLAGVGGRAEAPSIGEASSARARLARDSAVATGALGVVAAAGAAYLAFRRARARRL